MNTRILAMTALAILAAGALVDVGAADRPAPAACTNAVLMDAVAIIDQACTGDHCEFLKLKELDALDKGALLAAMQHPDMKAVHLFYPSGKVDLKDVLDWGTIKKAQLDTLKYLDDPQNTVVYIIGQASTTGSASKNRLFSQARMQNILNYLKDDLMVNCHDVRGAYVGAEILQLAKSDATFLRIEENDFRKDGLILNQSVHVFVVPCAKQLAERRR